MGRKILIAPSILAADFSRLGEEVKRVEEAGCDLLHIDIMDGHFVPNITIGPEVIKSLRDKTQIPFDVHLMIEEPARYIKSFIDAGSNILTVHIEAVPSGADEVVSEIKRRGVKAGIALNPETPFSAIQPILDKVDLILVMSVHPGFGGQVFMESVLPKISQIRENFNGDIEVDGGIDKDNAQEVIASGANILVAGSYIFGSENIKEAIERLKDE